MFILSVSRPCSSVPVQPSHFVFWTRFTRVFSYLLRVSLCTHSKWQPPTYPPSLLVILWSLYSHIFPRAAEVSEACSDTGSSRSHSFHLPSLPRDAISSFMPCSQYDSTVDGISQTWTSSQRSGKGQKGKPAVGDPQFDTVAKGSQLTAWSMSSTSSVSSMLRNLTKGKRYCTSHHRDTKKPPW